MADSVHTTTLPVSRRHLLAGAGAVALASASTATAETATLHPDAELLALGEELKAAWKAEKALPPDASDEMADAASEPGIKIIDRIAVMRARTMDGMRVKALAFLWCGHEPGETLDDLFNVPSITTDTKLALSIVGDLARDVSDDVRRLAVWRAA